MSRSGMTGTISTLYLLMCSRLLWFFPHFLSSRTAISWLWRLLPAPRLSLKLKNCFRTRLELLTFMICMCGISGLGRLYSLRMSLPNRALKDRSWPISLRFVDTRKYFTQLFKSNSTIGKITVNTSFATTTSTDKSKSKIKTLVDFNLLHWYANTLSLITI